MLISFLALIALINAILGHVPSPGGGYLSLERIFGWVFSPVAWSMGVPWRDAGTVGTFDASDTVLTTATSGADGTYSFTGRT